MKAFKPGVRMSIFALLLLPVLLSLGSWQLQRGALKRELEQEYLQQLTRLPVDLAQYRANTQTQLGEPLPIEPFTRLRMTGRYVDQMFFLDNQVSNGDVGYWLLQVFVVGDGPRLLINRGFVAAPRDRETLPVVDSPTGNVTLIASVWPDLGLPPLFGDETWSAEWPKRIQRKNLQKISQAASLWATELRLEPGQPGTLQAAPFAEPLSDAKHRGYALTWFGLAVALVIGYVVYGVRQGSVRQQSVDKLATKHP
jgi:cytochrome oxidase assembly protein ShyY1